MYMTNCYTYKQFKDLFYTISIMYFSLFADCPDVSPFYFRVLP